MGAGWGLLHLPEDHFKGKGGQGACPTVPEASSYFCQLEKRHGLKVAPPGLLAGLFAQWASLLTLQGSLGTGAGQAEEPAE